MVGKGLVQYGGLVCLIGREIGILPWYVNQGVSCEGSAIEPWPGEGEFLRFKVTSRVCGGVMYVEVTKHKCGGRTSW